MAVTTDPKKPFGVTQNVKNKVAAATAGLAPVTPPVTAPVTAPTPGVSMVPQGVKDKVAAATANITTPPVTAPTAKDTALSPFGGQDAYIASQLERFKGGNATLQNKINTDLSRFGVKSSPITGRPETPGFTASSLAGATLGSDNGQSFFQLPDGSREWVDTPEELEIANNISNYQSQLDQIKGLQAAGLQQNQSDFNYANNQLNQGEAVAGDSAQQLQNRRGGLYSGGLDYQLGGIQRSYGEQRGQLAQQFQRANQELLAKYGSQTDQIRNNLNNLLSTAPGLIKQSIEAAAAAKAEAEQKKRDSNLQAALDFTKATGYLVNPQEDRSGFWRQVQQGAPLTPDKQLDIAKFTEEQKQNLFNNNLNIQKFEEDKRQFGLDYALRENAQALQQDDNLRQWAALDFQQSQGGDEYKGLTPDQIVGNIRQNYLVYDDEQDRDIITRDPAQRKQIFLDVLDSSAGLSESQIDQILRSLGITKAEQTKIENSLPK